MPLQSVISNAPSKNWTIILSQPQYTSLSKNQMLSSVTGKIFRYASAVLSETSIVLTASVLVSLGHDVSVCLAAQKLNNFSLGIVVTWYKHVLW